MTAIPVMLMHVTMRKMTTPHDTAKPASVPTTRTGVRAKWWLSLALFLLTLTLSLIPTGQTSAFHLPGCPGGPPVLPAPNANYNCDNDPANGYVKNGTYYIGEKFRWSNGSIIGSGGRFASNGFPTKELTFKHNGLLTGEPGFIAINDGNGRWRAEQVRSTGRAPGSIAQCKYTITIFDLAKADGKTGEISTAAGGQAGCIDGDRQPVSIEGTIEITGTPPRLAEIISQNTSGGKGDPLCKQLNSGGLGWALCSIGQFLVDGAKALDNEIIQFLHLEPGPIFGSHLPEDQVSSRAFRTAWGIFRNLAYALLIIIGIIMVISQIMGLDMFDAYTIRKMLPKLVMAVIFISLIWPLLKLLFEMSNQGSLAIMDLIQNPFKDIGRATGLGDVTMTTLLSGAGVGAIGGAAAFFAIGGWGVFLAMVASMMLAALSAFFLLAARDVVAYALVIMSPIAIIAGAFEPFKKLFTLWRTLLITILLSIPAVAAVLAASKAAAKIAIVSNDEWGVVLAAVFIVAGYALFWKIFQQLDKVAGQIGSIANNVTGKAQKALAGYRGEARKQRLNEAVEGRRNFGGALGWFGNRGAGMVRRGRLASVAGAGAFGIGRTGRAKYDEAVRTMQAQASAKMMEQDKDRSGGDDDAMRLLGRRGMTEDRFLREYSELQRRNGASESVAMDRARSALGLAESSLGAKAGSNSMRVAAQKSLLKSNTSYRKTWEQDPTTGEWKERDMKFDEMSRQMYGDVAELMQDGLITAADGASMIKANGARADRAGVGFGTVISQLDRVARDGVGSLDAKTDKGITHLEAMADEALIGTPPGQMVGQRHEAVRMLAPQMLRRARAAAERDSTDPETRQRIIDPETGKPVYRLERELVEQIAMGARVVDMAGQLPELNASLQATKFVGQEITEGQTMGQWIDFMRTPSEDNPVYKGIFEQHRRAVESNNPGAPADQIDTQARAETRRVVEDAQRIFQEYRREYGSGWQAAAGQPPPEAGKPPGQIPGT